MNVDPHLEPTPVIESRHPLVEAFAEEAADGAQGEVERAVRLFYAVRDAVRYDPYTTRLERDEFRASLTLERKVGFCVPKAVLLAAAARALGIPSRDGWGSRRSSLQCWLSRRQGSAARQRAARAYPN